MTEVNEYLKEMKEYQQRILEFIDCNVNEIEEKFMNLCDLFKEKKNKDKKQYLEMIFNILVSIIDNHFREPMFFDKIKQILLFFKDSIKKYFDNEMIFEIFKSNKIILLFLIKQNILIIDQIVFEKITNGIGILQKYPEYFSPELKNVDFHYEYQESPEVTDPNFYDKRKSGENDNTICKIIREDSIEELIISINKGKIKINDNIPDSIYETNLLLLRNEVSLIEYAAFFGSTQIFKYLYKNKAICKPSIIQTAIHSNNPEIIDFLQESNINEKTMEYYFMCFDESIKCHHNQFADYFYSNYIYDSNQNQNTDVLKEKSFFKSIKYHNFTYIYPEFIDKFHSFCYFCQFNYHYLVQIFLDTKESLINLKMVYILIIISWNFKLLHIYIFYFNILTPFRE